MDASPNADLVLVGGGHAHVQVLQRWGMAPVAGVRLSLVLDGPTATYSGMVPGYVAGDYGASDLEIDVVPLARRARARVVLARAEAIDAASRRIELCGRPPLRYDVASLDVGSTVRGLELPGVRRYALATRPIGRFVEEVLGRVEALSGRSEGPGRLRIAVVGGGAAGVELALTLEARLRSMACPAAFTLLTQDDDVLQNYARRVRRLVRQTAEARGIRLRTGVRVEAVQPDGVQLADARLPADLVVWATGAAPLPFPRGPGLPIDDEGFVRVRPTLAVEGFDDLFAVGDCASIAGAAWVPKAGVYAVRAGPVLDANLRARLCGRPLRAFRPQRDFLTLLNIGDRRAIGTKWGVALAGSRIWQLKDWIDRRFVRRFQQGGEDGASWKRSAMSASPGMAEMECGGCAAKVGASALEAALGRLAKPPADPSVRIGLAEAADAAVLVLPRGDVLVATLDAFRAFTDDPWWVGRVAAVNAVSDVLAVGGRARHALALVNVPESHPRLAEETLYQVLAGVRAALDPLGVSLVGGHSTRGGALYVGLAVTGQLEDDPLPRAGLSPGDCLVLSKPLGSGVLLAADMRGLLPGRCLGPLLEGLARPNVEAARIARAAGAGGCTDVSGFGVALHLAPLLRESGVSARLFAEALPAWPGARALLARGVRSTHHAQNRRRARDLVVSRSGPEGELIFDPQTSGGLLFGAPADRAEDAVRKLHAAGDTGAAVIGVARPPRGDGALLEVIPRASLSS